MAGETAPGKTEFRLLGPLAVRVSGVAVPVPPGQQRMLLPALLLQAGQPLSAGELAELLWGEALPAPKVSLQNCVMRLRRSLGASASAIVTVPGGYLIAIGWRRRWSSPAGTCAVSQLHRRK